MDKATAEAALVKAGFEQLPDSWGRSRWKSPSGHADVHAGWTKLSVKNDDLPALLTPTLTADERAAIEYSVGLVGDILVGDHPAHEVLTRLLARTKEVSP
jgi:hypothetical protein